ncbi:type II toxin-antitoxin system Phd/YefM family antitoxin [Novosphingobium sp.]|uniref:type II toxin-antitoxin system Phd/YefM family antitoxin n=1 Tax=Novosphingobium sp. TaxID=1874826 RepID=UPI003D12D8B0
MDVISVSHARANLKQVMDRVVADYAPVIVSRHKAEAVVMVSLSDWNAIEESMHLLSTRANAERLMQSIAELDRR